jgi:hypothetical protein
MATNPNVYFPFISQGNQAPQTTTPSQAWTPTQALQTYGGSGSNFTGIQQRQMELDAIIAAANAEFQRLQEAGVNTRFAQQQAYDYANLELQKQMAAWQKEYQQQSLGLQLTQALTQLRGPKDWLAYSNLYNAQAGTNMAGYAQQALSNSIVPGFHGLNWEGMMKNSYAPVWQAINNAQAPGGTTATTPQQTVTSPGATPVFMPNINPQAVSQRTWNSMLPSQQQMLFGQLEQQGMDPNDWVAMMQKSWTNTNPVGITTWR